MSIPIKLLTIIVFSLTLAGCRKVSIQNEFATLHHQTKDLTHFDIYRNNAKFTGNEEIEKKIIDGLSREQAVDIALANNPILQASFEGLGIAKSDLSQAGLYSNPTATSAIYPSLQKISPESPAVEAGLLFSISDLWQVPLRKRVKKNELEIISLSILALILDTIAQTRRLYDNALYLQEKIKIEEAILGQTKQLRDDIYKRSQFGLSSNLDKDLSDISVAKAHSEIIKLKKELNHAFINLKTILGLHPTSTPINLKQELEHRTFDIPSIETLEQWGINHRPELQKAWIKIKQYEDELTLEKAKVFKDVNVGVAYKKEFGNQGQGVGPSISLELPFFDFNQAQVSKREYLLNQALKEFEAEKIKIQQEIHYYYEELMALISQTKIYKENLLPKNEKSLEYTKQHEQVMQITTLILLQTRTSLFENTKQLISLYHDTLNAFTNLERSVGKKLEPTESEHAKDTA